MREPKNIGYKFLKPVAISKNSQQTYE